MKFEIENLTQNECIGIAHDCGLGPITFIDKVALNSQTGKPMTLGYVGDHLGHHALFCKRHSGHVTYNLCNEYKELEFV